MDRPLLWRSLIAAMTDHHRAAAAATRLQRATRVRIERTALRNDLCGVLQKSERGMPLPLGLEFIVWRDCFVFVTSSALCCQRLMPRSSSRTDVLSTQLLRFADIVDIVGQLGSRTLSLHKAQVPSGALNRFVK